MKTEVERKTAYAAAGSIENSLMAQGSVTPVGNCGAQTGMLRQDVSETKPLGGINIVQSEELRQKLMVALSNGVSVDYMELYQAGLKLVYIDDNRKISKSHVKNLKESFKRVHTMFDDISVLQAIDLLEDGIALHDGAGNKLTLQSEGIEYCYAIIDGQHRNEALELYYSDASTKAVPVKAGVKQIAIPEGTDVRSVLAERNLIVKRWTCNDTKRFIEFMSDGDDTVISRVNKCVAEDGMSTRGAWKIYKLTDGYKKAKLEKAVLEGSLTDELRGTQAEIERGDKIRRAIQVGCRHEPKMKHNSAIIDMMISAYNSVVDESKASTMHLLLLFITSIPEVKMKAAMDEDTVDKKTECLKKEWMLFLQAVETDGKEQDFTGLAQKASNEYDAMVAAEVATSSRTRKTRKKSKAAVK